MCAPGTVTLGEEFNAMDAFFDRLWHYQSVVSPKARCERAKDSSTDYCRAATEDLGNVVSQDSVGQTSCDRSYFPSSITGSNKNLQGSCSNSDSSPSIPVSGNSLSENTPGTSCNNARGHGGIAAINRGSASNKTVTKQLPRTGTELQNSGHEILLLQKVFDVFDKNKDGQVSIEELSSLLIKLGLETALDELSVLVSTVATEGAGSVDFNQFVSLFHGAKIDARDKEQEGVGTIREEEDVEGAFRVFDMNGDGLISSSELRTLLSVMGIYEAEEGREYEKMIEKVDLDGNGYIDIIEFKNMMRVNCWLN